MFRFVLLLLALSGLQAVPVRLPTGLQKSSSTYQHPHGFQPAAERSDVRDDVLNSFRQGTEPSRRFLVDLNTGLVREHASEMERKHWLRDEGPAEVPVQKNGGGWVRVEERAHLPDGFREGTEPFMPLRDGFRQGTEPFMPLRDGFRQGTEPFMRIRDGFRQGTEPFMRIRDGFRQGTEPFMRIRDGFRQGTEPFMRIRDGFRQGTEPFMRIRDGFRQGTEPFMRIRDGFRQGTEPFMRIQKGFRQGTEPINKYQQPRLACQGEIINENCYEFNPTPLSFKDAQAKCRTLAPNAELASVTNGDLHSHLVSLVTKGGKRNPVLTWLGAIVKNQQASWVDGSEWGFSDWMLGHPKIHTDKPVCVEMFKQDESWWTTANCDLLRASICRYTITA